MGNSKYCQWAMGNRQDGQWSTIKNSSSWPIENHSCSRNSSLSPLSDKSLFACVNGQWSTIKKSSSWPIQNQSCSQNSSLSPLSDKNLLVLMFNVQWAKDNMVNGQQEFLELPNWKSLVLGTRHQTLFLTKGWLCHEMVNCQTSILERLHTSHTCVNG